MRTGSKAIAWSVGLTALLVATIVVSASIGPVPIKYSVITSVLADAFIKAVFKIGDSILDIVGIIPLLPNPNLKPPETIFSGGVEDKYRTIILNIRLPRIMVGAIVGFALAAAGTVMQGFFRNPMADPSIIGVSSGAAVGAVATIALPVGIVAGAPIISDIIRGFGSLSNVPVISWFFAPLLFLSPLALAAFIGGLTAAFGVYLVATEDGRTPVATLLLAGVAIQTFLGAVISFLLLQSGEGLRRAVYWLMGNLLHRNWNHVRVSLVPVFAGFGVLLIYSRDLNILLLGEEDAHNLGVEVERTKKILLGVSSAITAIAVAVSGVIGFVGLMVPHIMRLIVGPDHRILLPTSALGGASFLVATDTVARTALGAEQIPVGIVTAFFGAPFFLYLLREREVHQL